MRISMVLVVFVLLAALFFALEVPAAPLTGDMALRAEMASVVPERLLQRPEPSTAHHLPAAALAMLLAGVIAFGVRPRQKTVRSR